MFSEKRIVRLSECGSDGYITLRSLLSYCQDISESCDYFYNWGTFKLRESGYCYVILSWDIIINNRVKMNDVVEIKMYNNKNNGRFIVKTFDVTDDRGMSVSKATVNIGVCSLNGMHLSEGPKEMTEATPIDEYWVMSPLSLFNNYEKNSFISYDDIVVSRAFTDVNGHVNNVNYISLISSEMPSEDSIKRAQIYYTKAVLAEEKVTLQSCEIEDGKIVRLISKETGETTFLARLYL